jgi:EAL domain-containing protein (putative c-di-GMP-specific phosphodiesterase class I)
MRLSVNLSTQEFSRADLVQRIAGILRETNVDATFLDLEIRESVLFRDAMRDYATCRDLKALGVGIVIDDYGTGACSLAHLAQSPADAIKIDNTFVANIETSNSDRAACTAATALAEKLGIKVIAEGVETNAQAEFLRDNGCDFLQGFLFSEPLPDDDVLDYLARPTVAR